MATGTFRWYSAGSPPRTVRTVTEGASERRQSSKPGELLLAALGLGLGAVVALVTAATQIRRFARAVSGVFGGDLLNVAYVGLAAAALILALLVRVRGKVRVLCAVGLLLSLTPVALLLYYVNTTAG